MSVYYSEIFKTPITELAELALKKPDDFGYWGPKDMFVTWGFTGHDNSGASTILDEANFKAICDDLMTRFPNDFRIEHYNHWAVGWVDRLVCRILIHKDKEFIDDNISEAFVEAIKYHTMLADYPIIDETLYADMEALEISKVISDLPIYMSDMIDTDDETWLVKVLASMYDSNIEICPDAGIWPTDNDILMAVYTEQLWNTENIALWEDFCSENGLELPSKKPNPNQLRLFE